MAVTETTVAESCTAAKRAARALATASTEEKNTALVATARLLELATPPPAVPPARVLPLARYLRPATHYALPLATPERRPEGDPV